MLLDDQKIDRTCEILLIAKMCQQEAFPGIECHGLLLPVKKSLSSEDFNFCSGWLLCACMCPLDPPVL
jgi:hypothetical protein